MERAPRTLYCTPTASMSQSRTGPGGGAGGRTTMAVPSPPRPRAGLPSPTLARCLCYHTSGGGAPARPTVVGTNPQGGQYSITQVGHAPFIPPRGTQQSLCHRGPAGRQPRSWPRCACPPGRCRRRRLHCRRRRGRYPALWQAAADTGVGLARTQRSGEEDRRVCRLLCCWPRCRPSLPSSTAAHPCGLKHHRPHPGRHRPTTVDGAARTRPCRTQPRASAPSGAVTAPPRPDRYRRRPQPASAATSPSGRHQNRWQPPPLPVAATATPPLPPPAAIARARRRNLRGPLRNQLPDKISMRGPLEPMKERRSRGLTSR